MNPLTINLEIGAITQFGRQIYGISDQVRKSLVEFILAFDTLVPKFSPNKNFWCQTEIFGAKINFGHF